MPGHAFQAFCTTLSRQNAGMNAVSVSAFLPRSAAVGSVAMSDDDNMNNATMVNRMSCTVSPGRARLRGLRLAANPNIRAGRGCDAVPRDASILPWGNYALRGDRGSRVHWLAFVRTAARRRPFRRRNRLLHGLLSANGEGAQPRRLPRSPAVRVPRTRFVRRRAAEASRRLRMGFP